MEVAGNLREQNLEAVLIGNAAAALKGAPVTTVDPDVLIRKTAANLRKPAKLADAMGGVIFRPHYPVAGLYRVIRNEDSLQLDFMTQIHGALSFSSLRSRAVEIEQEGERMTVASLTDIIASKQAGGPLRDIAVLETLEQTLRQKQAGPS